MTSVTWQWRPEGRWVAHLGSWTAAIRYEMQQRASGLAVPVPNAAEAVSFLVGLVGPHGSEHYRLHLPLAKAKASLAAALARRASLPAMPDPIRPRWNGPGCWCHHCWLGPDADG